MTVPEFLNPPRLEPTGVPEAPLAAMLICPAQWATEVRCRIQQGGETWTLVFPAAEAGKYLLLGFLTEHAAEATVQLVSQDGTAGNWPEPLEFKPVGVPSGPHEMPFIEVLASEPDRMSPGFTCLSLRRRAIGRPPDHSPAQRAFTRSWGMLVALDARGRVRWLRKLGRRPAGLDRLASGSLIFHDTESCMREIDAEGRIARKWYAAGRPQGAEPDGTAVDVKTLHHMPHELPSGNFLALSGHGKFVRNWPASYVDPKGIRADRMIVGDEIVEFTTDGEIVWRWNAFDHLDTGRIGYEAFDAYWEVRGFPGHADWTHGNGVTQDPRDGGVIVSFRCQDALLKIDRRSSEIVWILGDHGDWRPDLAGKLLSPLDDGDFRWHWHGHNPRVTSSGTIVMFDNGLYQARPGTAPAGILDSVSRAVEYDVDEDAGTVRQVWSSARNSDGAAEVTLAMGDAHVLEDSGNVLVVHSCNVPREHGDPVWDEADRAGRHSSELPISARVIEYARKPRQAAVFDVRIADPEEIIQWEAFCGIRLPSLYPKSSGVKMVNSDALLKGQSG